MVGGVSLNVTSCRVSKEKLMTTIFPWFNTVFGHVSG